MTSAPEPRAGRARRPSRVMIIGQPGSGKSTLARVLGSKTGLPVHHMDLIHWLPGWVEREKPDKIRLARAIEAGEAWIFEGGLGATKANRLRRADMLIVLDFPLWLRAWRIFKRTVRHHGQSRPDLPRDCPEEFNAEFWYFIWRTRATARAANLALMGTAGPDVVVHHLRSPRAVRRFLREL